MHAMLKLLASILLISTTLGHPLAGRSSESWFQGLLKRSKRGAEFPLIAVGMQSSTPSTLTLLTGSSQFIECETGGYPSPTIYWLKDGRRLSKGELNYNDTGIPRGMRIIKSRVYLDDVTPDQAGSYTCVAENYHSSRRKETKVNVVESDGNEQRNTVKRQIDLHQAARIEVWTTSSLEIQGNDVRLYCRSEGTPSPTVVWLTYEMEEIKDGDKYKVHENGDLTIKNLSWEDMGEYTCRSENTHGSDSAQLFVYPVKPENEN